MSTTSWFAAIALVAGMLATPGGAAAQSREQVQAAQAQWRREPSVSDAVQAALEYFRVTPESFDSFRTAARMRAVLPTLAAGFRFDDSDFDLFRQTTISTVTNVDEQSARRDYAISVGGIWDLRDLVFNPAEVQIYGLIGVQRDIMLEVTRTYFLRRQLLLRLATRPPEDPIAYAALELAIDEFTAILDVLTGGWFSRAVTDRARGRAD